MTADILSILGAGVRLWEHSEKMKYIEELNEIQDKIHQEMQKPQHERDQSMLDHLEWRVLLVGRAWVAQINGSNALHPSGHASTVLPTQG